MLALLSKTPLAPYIAQIKIAIVVAFVVFIGLLFWRIHALEGDKAQLTEKVGSLSIQVNQHKQTIADQETEIARMREQKAIDDQIMAGNRQAIHALRRQNSQQKSEIGDLKRDNQETFDYLNTVVDSAIIRLFNVPASNDNENGIRDSPDGVNDGHPDAIYRTESIIVYALDLQTALKSCNEDKASLREWAESINRKSGS